jgi:hypothetical protein
MPLFYGRTTIVRRPWVDGIWTTPLTRLQLDEAVVERDRPADEPEPVAVSDEA